MSDNEKQHYIPQKILNKFSSGKKEMVFWLDKNKGEVHHQHVKKIGFVKYYYDYPNSQSSLEKDFFEKIDNDTPNVIKKIINDRSINFLSGEEKETLIRYVASQLVRTPQTINQMRDFDSTIKEQIHPDFTLLKKDLKTDYLDSIIYNTDLHIELLNGKAMNLHEAGVDESFIIGDAPVLGFSKLGRNTFDIVYRSFPPVINYDLYFIPISSKLLLSFVNKDPSLAESFIFYRSLHNDFQFISAENYVFSHSKSLLISELNKFYENSFEYIKCKFPDLIERDGLVKGQPISIARTQLLFQDDVRGKLKEYFINNKR
ncbi:DUF4238 domain-containing protein [Pectobacterium carotovorum]|uniref:DUF4238 domain-containing protein n=1 Tax=Pectobacterium carotovorum TaxID=554 RepID=UPI00254F7230|nr:DUF4238 domain-containing protein [Pectobacterium carotovorum]MDK9421999.1 DUF4238 domain-containing protein [Pectobacterium carotovorum]